MADADIMRYATRLRHSLLDLSRRLQYNPNEEMVDFIIFRLEQILRHLTRMGNRFDEVSGSI